MKVFDFLKKRKKENQDNLVVEENLIKTAEEKNIDIRILHKENYSKIIIADNYKIQDYSNKMQEIDTDGINELLNSSVIWNSHKQSVNKGNYYVFRHNDKFYNILINDENIKIDERTPVGEEILNKVFTFPIGNSGYRYFRCMHDKNGSSYDTRYYNPAGTLIFELPKEEFLKDFNETIQNLISFKNIENILELNKLKNIVEKPNLEDEFSK